VSEVLPTGQLSNIPWRRAGVKYTNNEAYFDVIEEVDAIIDKSGSTVSTEIHGYIDCSVKLSGMPDLTMSFVNPRLFDDVSFHPCVRYTWELHTRYNLLWTGTRNGRAIGSCPSSLRTATSASSPTTSAVVAW
jgi:hypothetical protein